MNNRNPNKENTYSNLAAWCAKYHKDSGIKIHPSSVPVDLVLEDVMGWIGLLMAHDKTTTLLLDQVQKRMGDLEILVHELASQFTEVAKFLAEKVDEKELVPAEPIKPSTKKVKK